MQIELKCKINVKNEKRKPNLPMLPRFAQEQSMSASCNMKYMLIILKFVFCGLRPSAVPPFRLPSVQKPIAVRIASNESAAVTFPSPSASAAASAAPLR